MTAWDREKQGRDLEGYAFTFCKAALLVLIFERYSLLALSGLATLFYLLAAAKGVRKWHCWAKPPWITLFWGVVFVIQLAFVIGGKPLLLQARQLLLPHLP
ncbi:MAG TPA: hypothetical protein VFW40_03590 [Capsulimonadaceae bacterium]|nr:hypothetical protein [Capsulimonadaceae bacterium]